MTYIHVTPKFIQVFFENLLDACAYGGATWDVRLAEVLAKHQEDGA
jgi:hypothetical protein